MTKTNKIKSVFIAALVGVSLTTNAIADADCAPEVSKVMDQQRQAYIASYSDLASKNFSKRPGTFASTTCLDNLMKGGGMDIFFKPPSLDNILGMVKNLACEQASQIFNSVLGGGGGLNGGGALNPGEILKGINLGGGQSGSPLNLSTTMTSIKTPSIGNLFK